MNTIAVNAAATTAAPEQRTLTSHFAGFLRFIRDSFADPLGESRTGKYATASVDGVEAIRLVPIEVDGLEEVFDDLAYATWEDAEWQ